jgi:hypothetical protein
MSWMTHDPILIDLRVTRDAYPIIWLRRVRGFNPAVHCMESLVGNNDRQLCPVAYGRQGGRIHGVFNLDGHDFGYLCGVGSPTRLDLNLHVPFEPAPGESFEVNERGIDGAVENARRVPIQALPEDSDTLRAWGLNPEFYFRRCRNYIVGFARYGTPKSIALGVTPATLHPERGQIPLF